MTQISIVIFREIFEILLIIGVLAAATSKIAGSKKFIFSGVFIGLLLSLIVALFIDSISNSFKGVGQEILNGSIMIAASIMISSTVIWMQANAKHISSKFRKLGDDVEIGQKSVYAISIIAALTTLREGAEIVLFMYSYYIAGIGTTNLILGFILGAALGIGVGICFYIGMMKTFGRYFLAITSWMLIFISSGILAQGVGFFVNAGIINPLADPLFDSSGIVSGNSFIGQTLHIILGYMDRPSGAQFLAYSLNILALVAGVAYIKSKIKPQKQVLAKA